MSFLTTRVVHFMSDWSKDKPLRFLLRILLWDPHDSFSLTLGSYQLSNEISPVY